MELNDWAKQELGMFCESLIEEHEELITELVRDSPELFKRGGDVGVLCKAKLDLCQPPPPPEIDLAVRGWWPPEPVSHDIVPRLARHDIVA